VVAERDHVRARGEELLRELRRQAAAVGCVLAVDDAEVCAELVAQARQMLFDGLPARGADDVRDEEELQCGASVAAGWTSTVT
jgi:hypothetical protein